MNVDLEEILTRELRQVVDGLHVPALPALPQEPPRSVRRWPSLLVAAVVVLVLAGVIVAMSMGGGGRDVSPAPSPTPTPTPTPAPTPTNATPISKKAPTVPYVLDQKLYVDGQQVPGDWWLVRSGAEGWVGQRTDDTWWRGTGPEAIEIEGQEDAPVISANGRYVGETRVEDGKDVLSGFETRPAGEGFGSVPVDLGDQQDGSAVTVRAVTDDGWVIAQGTKTAVLWRPLIDNRLVDLTQTAPGWEILASTPAGLLVTDGVDGDAYLAEISEAGEIDPSIAVPAHDDLAVSPGAAWLIWTDPGTTQGEVTSVPTLNAQSVNSRTQATLNAPDGYGFRTREWAWENDDTFIAPLEAQGEEQGAGRMARCSVLSAQCVLITAP